MVQNIANRFVGVFNDYYRQIADRRQGTVSPGPSGTDSPADFSTYYQQLTEARLQVENELPAARKDDPLYTACTQLAAVFYQQLFQAMRQTVPDDGLLAPGFGQEVFQDMLDTQFAEAAAGEEGDQLAELLYRQLSTIVVAGQEE